jgi:tRNA U34 2-thiouridine synthase MnmA/TrmU
MKKAIIAMSGGIDSAAAVYLTKQLNIDISGATIRTGNFSCNGIIKNAGNFFVSGVFCFYTPLGQ